MDSVAHVTTLDKLPIDIMRPIVRLVDAESLGQLYSTFNHKIQSLLSHPNMFSTLSMIPTTNDARAGPYR